MLDSDRSKHFAVEGSVGDIPDAGGALSFADIIAIVRRQFVVLVVFLFIGLGAGVAFLVFFKPAFQASATILIDTRKYPETAQSDIAARTVYDSSAAIDTQVEILKSQTLARAVVEKLALWREPEFITSAVGPRAMISKYLLFNRAPENLTPEESRGRAIAYFFRHLTVKRVADTFTIDISFESPYADEAAKVANATAEAFIDWQRNLHRAAIASAGEWLDERIKDLREKTTIGRQSVAEYQAKNNVYDAGGGGADERRLNDLSNQWEAARAQATDVQVKLALLSQFAGAGGSGRSDLEIISAIENASADPSITAFRLRYLDLTARYAQLSKLLPSNHQVLVDLRNQIQSMHGEVLGELSRAQLMLKNNRDTAQAKAADLQAQITSAIRDSRAAATAQAGLKQLELNAQTYQNLYDSFLHRYAEALQGDRSPAAEATIISAAEPPTVRNYKKALLVFAALPALGLLIGAGIAFLRERVNRPFWTSREVENELKLPCADVIPEIKPRELKRAKETFLRSNGSRLGEGRRPGLRGGDPLGLYALVNPLSRFAESLRSVRIALKINNFEGAQRAVGVTSAFPGEGKSTIALALAASVANTGVRTVLVDCDFRKSTLTKSWLGQSRRLGVVDVLFNGATLDDAIQVDEDTQLHFVPCGFSQVRGLAGELMTNDGLMSLIRELKNRYDLVIVDLPPMSPINDVAISQNFIDGYLLVVEWGKTKVASVNFAMQKMPQVYASTISVVLNKTNMNKLKKFGFQMRDYYSGEYASHYIVK